MKLKIKAISGLALALMAVSGFAMSDCDLNDFKKDGDHHYTVAFTCYDFYGAGYNIMQNPISIRFDSHTIPDADSVSGLPGIIHASVNSRAHTLNVTSEAWYPEGTGYLLKSGETYELQFDATNDNDDAYAEWIAIGDLVSTDADGNEINYPLYPHTVKIHKTQAELDAKEAELTSDELMMNAKKATSTSDNAVVEKVSAKNPNNPDNVKRVESIVSEADWNFLFSVRSPEYSYENFLKAVAKFPALCGDYDDGRDADAICRKSLATMFAHFTQETGAHSAQGDVPEWRQGLYFLRESGYTEESRNGYNEQCDPTKWAGQTWPCGKFDNGEFKSYFGRGAKQLSYNYNYGPFSQSMYGDVSVLLDNPELVADTWLNLASAVFFFVYPQSPKPSMLHVVDGTWQPNANDIANGLTAGFGATTEIINGGLECGQGVEVAQSLNRISYYENFADYLGAVIPENEVLGCKDMQAFDAKGAGAINTYWEQDYATPYQCKLVSYQTPFSPLMAGDYTKCVQHFFPDLVID